MRLVPEPRPKQAAAFWLNLPTAVFHQHRCQPTASCKCLRMVAAKALNLAFEDLGLNRACAFVIALLEEKIPQSSQRPLAQIVVPTQVAAKVVDSASQQNPRTMIFACLPMRDRHMGHQPKSLGMIRAQKAFVRAKRR